MIILFFLALALSNHSEPHLLNNASGLSQSFQQKCLTLLPVESENHSALTSIVCGEKLTDQKLKQNLVKTSLIHIFVISGSHLILLDELLALLRVPFYLRFLLTGIYTLAVGWQPPAVRALIALGLRGTFKKLRWHFSSDTLTLIAGGSTLALFPEWWSSSSLLMSWCAALALSWSSLLDIKNKIHRVLFNQCAVFIFMCAPLWGLSALHPLALLYNLLLAPLVSYLLLPLGLLAMIVPYFVVAFDFVMSAFAVLLNWVAEPISTGTAKQISLSTLWFWIFAWQVFFHFLRLRLKQGRDSAWLGS
ncbi:ComEC/Rec2 family competence protein [Bdellovibrio sp. HCB209]|uniref:ComEC/Rec2 family competence protein n=1 Tax=Bdellovibrio sp. HCB209 TaxID=3394354 RepID=UPI0039B5F83A